MQDQEKKNCECNVGINLKQLPSENSFYYFAHGDCIFCIKIENSKIHFLTYALFFISSLISLAWFESFTASAAESAANLDAADASADALSKDSSAC